METLRLFLALVLPWWVGMVWLERFWEARPGRGPALAGYGYIIGMLATGSTMVLADALGFPLHFWGLAAVLGGLGAAGLILSWPLRGRAQGAKLSPWQKAFLALLLLLLAFRFLDLFFEILWRPLYPWDAWMNWAPKAKVWAYFKQLVPFVDAETWLHVEGAYSIETAPYPPFVPLVQTWIALGLGRWDESLVNLPWWQCAVALGCAFYGQLRYGGIGPVPSLGFTYLLLSMPFLDVHVALAGYADLWMGTVYGLAAMAFFHAFRERSGRQAALALLLALACTQVKVPGIAWMLTFLPAFAVAVSPRWGTALLLALGALSAIVLAFSPWHTLPLSWLGLPDVALTFHPVVEPFLENTLVLPNWHLFWYLFLFALALFWKRAFSQALMPLTALALMACAFIVFIFFFTDRYRFALDYTMINRAMLHAVPLWAFYVAVLIKGGAWLGRKGD